VRNQHLRPTNKGKFGWWRVPRGRPVASADAGDSHRRHTRQRTRSTVCLAVLTRGQQLAGRSAASPQHTNQAVRSPTGASSAGDSTRWAYRTLAGANPSIASDCIHADTSGGMIRANGARSHRGRT